MIHVPPLSLQLVDSDFSDKESLHQYEYTIDFPPNSSMGLELEPVIVSSNPPRQLGCRVKDYYFGKDFIEYLGEDSWNRDFLLKRVTVGDVITKVGDQPVLNQSFQQILSQLRLLKDQSRIVCFKNISATWSKAREHINLTSPSPSPNTPITTNSSTKATKDIQDIDRSNAENIPNQSSTPSSFKIRTPRTGSQKMPKLSSSSIRQCPTPQSTSSRSLLPPKHNSSNNNNASVSTSRISPTAIKELVNITKQLSPSPTVCSSPVVPKSKSYPGYSFIEKVGESLGTGILNVGSGAVDAALSVGMKVGTAIEEQAAITSTYLPVYNSIEMSRVQATKYDLLNELSHYCVLLGQYEDKQKGYATIEKTNIMYKNRIIELEQILEFLSTDKEMVYSKINELECQLNEYHNEIKLLEKERDYMKHEKNETVNENKALVVLNSKLEDKLRYSEDLVLNTKEVFEREKDQFLRKETDYTKSIESISDEHDKLKKEIESVMEHSYLQIQLLEKERDSLHSEIEVLKDFESSNKNLREAELQRLRDNINSQQVLHTNRLDEKEIAIDELKKELNAMRIIVSDKDNIITKLQTELVGNDLLIKDFNKESISTMESNKILLNQRNGLENDLNIFKSQFIELQSEFGKQVQQIKSMEHENNNLNSHLSLMKNELDQSVSATKNLKTELDDAKNELSYKDLINSEILYKMQSLEEREKDLIENHKLELLVLNTMGSSSNDKDKLLEEKCRALQSSESLNRDNQIAIEKFRMKEEEYLSLQEAMNSELSNYIDKFNSVLKQEKITIGENKNLIEKNELLLYAINQSNQTIKSLNETILDLQRKHDESISELNDTVVSLQSDYELSLNELSNSIEVLKRDNICYSDRLKEVMDCLHQAEIDRDEISKKYEDAILITDSLTSNKVEQEAILKELVNKNESLIQQVNNSNNILASDLYLVQESNMHLIKELDYLKIENSKLEDSNKMHTNIIEGINVKLSEAVDLYNKEKILHGMVRNEFEAIKRETQSTITDLRNELSLKDDRIKNQIGRLNEINQNLNHNLNGDTKKRQIVLNFSLDSVHHLKQDLKELRMEVEGLTTLQKDISSSLVEASRGDDLNELSDLKQKLVRLEFLKNKLDEEKISTLNNHNRAISAMEKSLIVSVNKIKSLEKENSELNSIKKLYSVEVQDLKKELLTSINNSSNDLVIENLELKNTINMITSDIKKLKDENSQLNKDHSKQIEEYEVVLEQMRTDRSQLIKYYNEFETTNQSLINELKYELELQVSQEINIKEENELIKSEKDKIIKSLQSELEVTKSESNRLRGEIHLLIKEQSSIEDTISSHSKSITELESDNATLSNIITELENSNKVLSSGICEYETELQNLQIEMDLSRSSIVSLNKIIDDSKDQENNRGKQIAELERNTMHLNMHIKEIEKRNSFLSNEIEKLSHDDLISTKQASLISNLEDHNNTNLNKIQELKIENSDLLAKVGELSVSLNNRNSELKESYQKFEELSYSFSSLKNQYQALNSNNDIQETVILNLSTSNAQLEEQFRIVNDHYNETKKSIEFMKLNYSNNKNSFNELSVENSSLRDNNKELGFYNDSLKRNIEDLSSTNQKLIVQIKEFQDDNNCLLNKIRDMESQNLHNIVVMNELESSNMSNFNYIKELESKCSEMSESCLKSNSRNSLLEVEVEQLGAINDDYKSTIKDLEVTRITGLKHIEELSQEIKISVSRYEEIKKELEAHRNEYEALTHSYNNSKNLIEKHTKTIKYLESENSMVRYEGVNTNEIIKDLRERNAFLELCNNDFKEIMKNNNADIENRINTINILEQNLSIMNSEYSKLMEEINERNVKLFKAESDIEGLQVDNENLCLMKKELMDAIDELDNRVKLFETFNADLQDIIKNNNSDLINKSEIIRELEHNLSLLKKTDTDIVHENKKLHQTVSTIHNEINVKEGIISEMENKIITMNDKIVKIKEIESELSNKTTIIRELECNVIILKTNLKSVSEQSSVKNQTIKELECQIIQLQSSQLKDLASHKDMEQNIKTLENNLNIIEIEKNKLINDNKELKLIINKLNNKLITLNGLELTIQDLSNSSRLILEENNHLKLQIEDLVKLGDTNNNYQNDIVSLQLEIIQYKELINSYLNGLNTLSNSNNSLKQQVSEYMSTINVQQNVLSQAEQREHEYNSNRIKLETHYENKIKDLMKSNSNLSNSIDSSKDNEKLIKEELERKTNELNNLYAHVTALLSVGDSKAPADKLNKPLANITNPLVSGKENAPNEFHSDDKACVQDVDFVDLTLFENTQLWQNWHDNLIQLSLNLHEILTYGFYILKEDNFELMNEVLKEISEKHCLLHETVMKSPQLANRHTKPILTPAHELINNICSNNDSPKDNMQKTNSVESFSLVADLVEQNDLVRSSFDKNDNNDILFAMLKEDEISGNYSLRVENEIEDLKMIKRKNNHYNNNESFESATSEIWNISTDESEESNDISILSNHNI